MSLLIVFLPLFREKERKKERKGKRDNKSLRLPSSASRTSRSRRDTHDYTEVSFDSPENENDLQLVLVPRERVLLSGIFLSPAPLREEKMCRESLTETTLIRRAASRSKEVVPIPPEPIPLY